MRKTFSKALSTSRVPEFSGTELSDSHVCGHTEQKRTVLVTGGSQGIGLQVAKTLAAAGYRVIISSRDFEAGEKAAKEIVTASKTSKDQIINHTLDLANLKSIEAFAAALEHERLDIIICNAGIMCPPYGTTKDGFETTMGVNYYGHFYLLKLLTPQLKLQPFKSRLVVVSSARYQGSRGLDLDDLQYRQRSYRPIKAYEDSKLACILFAKEYDRRHSNTTAVAVDPGRCTSTNLTRYLGVSGSLSSIAFRTRSKSLQEAAASIIYAAVSRDLSTGAGGSYIEDCRVVEANMIAMNTDLAASLWKVTAKDIDQALQQCIES